MAAGGAGSATGGIAGGTADGCTSRTGGSGATFAGGGVVGAGAGAGGDTLAGAGDVVFAGAGGCAVCGVPTPGASTPGVSAPGVPVSAGDRAGSADAGSGWGVSGGSGPSGGSLPTGRTQSFASGTSGTSGAGVTSFGAGFLRKNLNMMREGKAELTRRRVYGTDDSLYAVATAWHPACTGPMPVCYNPGATLLVQVPYQQETRSSPGSHHRRTVPANATGGRRCARLAPHARPRARDTVQLAHPFVG